MPRANAASETNPRYRTVEPAADSQSKEIRLQRLFPESENGLCNKASRRQEVKTPV
jgi:hypothetical protein